MKSTASTGCADGGIGMGGHAPFSKIIQRISPSGWSYRLKESRMGDTDEELQWVLQSQKGDPTAFESLIRKHQRMVHSLTYRMTGSLDDAEDLAQETFIRAYAQIGSYRGAAKFSTWLYRIAVNVCLNWRQREARRTALNTDWATTNEPETSHIGGNSETSSARVQEALMKLPAKQRAAIVLTTYDGLNHSEAAQALGCSETTVSWRVFSARRKLKRWLEPREDANETL
jgi:RNA polymerase sigma-70 factor (ECF subfamily)